MFKFRPGKKINVIPIIAKTVSELPYIYSYAMELRSYDDLGNPETEVAVCLKLRIFRGGHWRNHDNEEIRYLDIKTKTLYNNLGVPQTCDAANIIEIINDAIKSFNEYKEKL